MSPLPFHQRIDLRRRVANAGVRPDADFYGPQEARIFPTDHRGFGEPRELRYLAPTSKNGCSEGPGKSGVTFVLVT